MTRSGQLGPSSGVWCSPCLRGWPAWGVLILGKVLTMDVLVLLLLLLGLVLFVLAGLGVGHPRVNLLALGLACWIATAVLAHPLVAG